MNMLEKNFREMKKKQDEWELQSSTIEMDGCKHAYLYYNYKTKTAVCIGFKDIACLRNEKPTRMYIINKED